jgi:hypothetical protein
MSEPQIWELVESALTSRNDVIKRDVARVILVAQSAIEQFAAYGAFQSVSRHKLSHALPAKSLVPEPPRLHGFPLHIGQLRCSRSHPSAAAIFSMYVVAFWIHVGNVRTTRIADVQRAQRKLSSLVRIAALLSRCAFTSGIQKPEGAQ